MHHLERLAVGWRVWGGRTEAEARCPPGARADGPGVSAGRAGSGPTPSTAGRRPRRPAQEPPFRAGFGTKTGRPGPISGTRTIGTTPSDHPE